MGFAKAENVEIVRECWRDVLDFSCEALREMSTPEAVSGFNLGLVRENQVVGAENWINSKASYVTEKALTKTTSNGPTWPERLTGATTFTKYHAFTVAETIRTERSHLGYQREDTSAERNAYFIA